MEDVEMMVNNPHRQAAIKMRRKREDARKQDKPLNNALVFALVGAVFILLGALGLAAPVIEICGGLTCLVGGAFNLGRFFENGKCNGWL